MTLDHIAAFAGSRSGKVYRDVCERFGVDPAAGSGLDDLDAFYLRLALALAHPPEEKPDTSDPFQAARDAAAKVKAMT